MTDTELDKIWETIAAGDRVIGWDGHPHGDTITLIDVEADTLRQRDAAGGAWEIVPKTGAGA